MCMKSKFSVYNHTLRIADNKLITKKLIVLKNEEGIMDFTNFHKYVNSPQKTVRSITYDGNSRFDYGVKLLNYAYFERGIVCLNNLTIDIVKDFMNLYGLGKLPGDVSGRTESTVKSCISAILDFLENLIGDKDIKCCFTHDDLYQYTMVRTKKGKIVKKKVPVFNVVYDGKTKSIFRDMPTPVFEIILNHIATYHPDLLCLVILSAFSGLRPSEACNVRREDSALGPGILFSMFGGKVSKVQIDLRKELCLRSDLTSTGKIKKERMQTVPLIFTDRFVEFYNIYMKYIEGKTYEADYGPLNLDKRGKAITYDTYYQRFRKIVRDELIPIFFKSEDPKVVFFGHLLTENNISPHIFRHWYTVQLVRSGMNSVAELMNARGDSSPESALTYLMDKGELEEDRNIVANEAFDYNSWAAAKKHNLKAEKNT